MINIKNDLEYTPLDTALAHNNKNAVMAILSSATVNINYCQSEAIDDVGKILEHAVNDIRSHVVCDLEYVTSLLGGNNIAEVVDQLKAELNNNTISRCKGLNIYKDVLRKTCVKTAKTCKEADKIFYTGWNTKLSNDQYCGDIVTFKSLIADFSKLKDKVVLTHSYSEDLDLVALKADLIEVVALREKYKNLHAPTTEVVKDLFHLERMLDKKYCYAEQITFYMDTLLALQEKDCIISKVSNIIDSVITKFTDLSILAKKFDTSLNNEAQYQLQSQLELVQELKDTLNLHVNTDKEIKTQELSGGKQKTRAVAKSSGLHLLPTTHTPGEVIEENICDTIPSEMISEMLYAKFAECAIEDYVKDVRPNNDFIHILATETALDYAIVIKTILNHEEKHLQKLGGLLKDTFNKFIQTDVLGKTTYAKEDGLDMLEKKSEAIKYLKDIYQKRVDSSQSSKVALEFQTIIEAVGVEKKKIPHNVLQKEKNSRLKTTIKELIKFCQTINTDLHLMTHEKHSHQTEKSGFYDRDHLKSTVEQFLSYADTKTVLRLDENTSFSKEIYDSILLNFAIQTSRNYGPHQKIEIAKLIPQRLQGDTLHNLLEMKVYHDNIIKLCDALSKARPSGVFQSVQCSVVGGNRMQNVQN